MNDITYVGLDVHKATVCVAIAESGRGGEVREVGIFENRPDVLRKMVARLGKQRHRLNFCYEAGPCGYGLHRLLTGLGHDCVVVAPSLIPMKAGDRVKTDRRDALMLARLHRAGELTPIWIPDAAHEAMRDLVRARATAVRALSKARQHLQGFLLRHDRICHGARAWTLAYRRWLTTVRFDHPAQQIVLQDYIHAVEGCRMQTRPADAANRRADADLVDGACRRGAPSDARGRSRRCGHGGGRSRRLSTLHQCSPADGLSRPRAERTFVREHRAARRDYQGRQCASTSRTDRGRLDLSYVRPRESETSRSSRATVRGDQGHRLESAGPAVRAISAPRCTGKPKAVVTTAIAREMVGFIWAIACVAQPALT